MHTNTRTQILIFRTQSPFLLDSYYGDRMVVNGLNRCLPENCREPRKWDEVQVLVTTEFLFNTAFESNTNTSEMWINHFVGTLLKTTSLFFLFKEKICFLPPFLNGKKRELKLHILSRHHVKCVFDLSIITLHMIFVYCWQVSAKGEEVLTAK